MKANQKSEKVKNGMCREGGNQKIKTSADKKKVGVSAGYVCFVPSLSIKVQTILLIVCKTRRGLRKLA